MDLRTSIFIALGIYALLIVILALYSKMKTEGKTLADFYLAGRGFGVFLLFFTLFATQYSGNTLLGFSGKAYRIGTGWLVSIHFMLAIVIAYHFIAKKLHKLSHDNNFITPSDYLLYRYGSRRFAQGYSILFIFALGNFLLAQLMALGRAVQAVTEGSGMDQYTVYIVGVVAFSLLMIIYENLGGLRAVVWTDALQGLLLFAGFLFMLSYLLTGGFSFDKLAASLTPEKLQQVLAPPEGAAANNWFSYIILVGLGGALYPQAIQRIYAAKSYDKIKRSLRFMAIAPLFTSGVAVFVGLSALIYFPGMSGAEADKALPLMLTKMSQSGTFWFIVTVVLFTTLVAAIMSTADSLLLSISSMVVHDLYRPIFAQDKPEASLTKWSKLFSWVLLIVLVGLAILLKETTLVQLLDRKFDIIIQMVPAFYIGLYAKSLSLRPVVWGVVVGLLLALGINIVAELGYYNLQKTTGFHPGIYGLAGNLLVVGLLWKNGGENA